MRATTTALLLCLALCAGSARAQTRTVRSPFVTDTVMMLDWSARTLTPDTTWVVPWPWCKIFICCSFRPDYRGTVYSLGYTYDGERSFLEGGYGYYFPRGEFLITEETRTDFYGRWDLGVNALFNTWHVRRSGGQVRWPLLRVGPTIGVDLWNGQSRPYAKGTVAVLGPLARMNIGVGYKVELSDEDIPTLREGFSFDLVVYLLPP